MNRMATWATTSSAVVAASALLTGTIAPAPAAAAPQHAQSAHVVHSFGDTIKIDGFKIKVTHRHDSRKYKGHYTEDINITVTKTKHHKKWDFRFKQSANFGVKHKHKSHAVGGQGFGGWDGRSTTAGAPWVVAKDHYAKDLHYTFTFKGHKTYWANDVK